MAASEVAVPAIAPLVGGGGGTDEGKELNGIVFESFSHTGTILKGLNELRLKGVLVDVTLRTDGKLFRVSVTGPHDCRLIEPGLINFGRPLGVFGEWVHKACAKLQKRRDCVIAHLFYL